MTPSSVSQSREGLKIFPFLVVNHLATEELFNHGPLIAVAATFMGVSTVVLVIASLVLVKDYRKYLFLGAYLFTLGLNATEVPPHTNPFHILNASTNPFSFLNRTFQSPLVAYVPLFLTPLIAMGMAGLLGLRRPSGAASGDARRFLRVLGVTGMVLLGFAVLWSAPLGVYVQVAALLGVFVLLALPAVWRSVPHPLAGRVMLAVFALVFAVEANAWASYMGRIQTGANDRGTIVSGVSGDQVVPDTIAPGPLRLREFISVDSLGLDEAGFESYFFEIQSASMYYGFVDFSRFTIPTGKHNARHESYDPIDITPLYDRYLDAVDTLFLNVPSAIAGDAQTLSDVVASGLTDEVIVIEADPGEAGRLRAEGWTLCDAVVDCGEAGPVVAAPDLGERRLSFELAAAREVPTGELGLKLLSVDSAGIPEYMSTVLFTADATRFRATIDGRDLGPVQGHISAPFSFDVHNIDSSAIVLSVPDDFDVGPATLEVAYDEYFESGVRSVVENSNDALGIIVESQADGWFLYHTPYDEDWRVSVNGIPVPAYRANGLFMAVPLREGTNEVLYEFLPGTIIRRWLLTSLLLAMACLMALAAFSFRTVGKPDESFGAA